MQVAHCRAEGWEGAGRQGGSGMGWVLGEDAGWRRPSVDGKQLGRA